MQPIVNVGVRYGNLDFAKEPIVRIRVPHGSLDFVSIISDYYYDHKTRWIGCEKSLSGTYSEMHSDDRSPEREFCLKKV